MRVLYVSYDGMLEPLGQSQVVNYVERLADDHKITLLSYEKPRDLAQPEAIAAMATRLRHAGIRWIRLRYHHRPRLSATAWDIVCGLVVGGMACLDDRIELIHARSYVASVIGLTLKRRLGLKLLFDMRGFWADEKLDAGDWTARSLAYRSAKRWERRFFEEADGIVSLTREGVRVFDSLGYVQRPDTAIEVIPTCVDVTRFSPGSKDPDLVRRLGLARRFVIGCVGTLGRRYEPEAMLSYIALLASSQPRVCALLVTQDPAEPLRQTARRAGLADEQLVIVSAPFASMPRYLRLLDLAVIFRKQTFAKHGGLATKLGELLAVGVPVVVNEGVGDAVELIEQEGVGIVLRALTSEAFAASLPSVQALRERVDVRGRCRQVAEQRFGLELGVARYRRLYERLQAIGSADAAFPAGTSRRGASFEPAAARAEDGELIS